MKQNFLSWLAMFLSAVAGTFCSQMASRYTDRKIESALSVPVAMTSAESAATVAFSRGASVFGAPAKN